MTMIKFLLRRLILISVILEIAIFCRCNKKEPNTPIEEQMLPAKFTLLEEKVLFTGGAADPSVIQMVEGFYLMYLNRFYQPDDIGYFILSSNNGISWQEETSIVFRGIATGRAFRESEGVSFYFPKTDLLVAAGGETPRNIVRPFSPDGLNEWSDAKILLRPKSGYSLGGSTVIRLPDGRYRLFFDELDLTTIGQGKVVLFNQMSYFVILPDYLPSFSSFYNSIIHHT